MAQHLGYRFLDTGAMYRAVAWAAIKRRIDLDDVEALARLASDISVRLLDGDAGDRLTIDGREVTDYLREPEVERGVSLVAKVPGVRSAMVQQQQAIAGEGPIVMAGRDIGTVVLPRARVKIFVKELKKLLITQQYILGQKLLKLCLFNF